MKDDKKNNYIIILFLPVAAPFFLEIHTLARKKDSEIDKDG